MKRQLAVLAAFSAFVAGAQTVYTTTTAGEKMPAVRTVPRELDVLIKAGHIQGATCSENNIYLSHQLGIEMIGWDGRLIRRVDAPAHLGDIAYANGKIYGAFVMRGLKKGEPLGLVRVWDRELNLLREKRLNDSLDGIVVLGETIYYGVDIYGKDPHPGVRIGRLDLDLNEMGTVDLDLGYYTHYGVQTMATDGKDIFLGNYGAPKDRGNPAGFNCTRVSADLKVLANHSFGCSEGFCLVPKSVSKRDTTVFFAVRALGGNMQGWRKDPVNNPPQIELRFYEYADSRFTDITAKH